MAGKRVIGVDLGGTKILAGIVDADGTVHETVERPTRHDVAGGAARRARGDRARAAAGRRRGGRLRRSRRGSTSTRASRSARSTSRSATCASATRCTTGSGCRSRWRTTRAAPRYAEFRLGAGRGADDLVAADARHRRRRRRRHRAGSSSVRYTELGHMVIVEDGEPCQGACSGRGHVEAYCSGPRGRQAREARARPGRGRARPRRAGHPALERDRPPPRRSRSARSSTSSARRAS